MKLFALVLFLITYVLLVAIPGKRVYTALISAAIFLIVGIVTPLEAWSAINWNVLLMIAGTMITVVYFIDSKMPDRIADLLLQKAPNVMWVIIFMSLFSGVVSAFMDNVATVLMLAPVGLSVAKKLKISPVPMLVCISVSSNLQGAATLVGDTTSIMLGGYAGMDFTDFFWMLGKPGIFWAVELGAIGTVFVMMYLFRKEKQKVDAGKLTEVKDYVPSYLLLGTVLALIFASFFQGKPALTNGIICMIFALIGAIYTWIKDRSPEEAKHALAGVDFETLGLLLGLFIVIEGLTQAGIVNDIANLIVKLGGDNLFVLYTLIVWLSVAASAFIDNIPYVATMLPVVAGVASILGTSPYLLFFGLLTGATLGGNITPIGASANITMLGILKKEGYEVKAGEFMKISVPFTLVAVVAGYVFLWLVWA
ncbi:MAG: arsenic transporter [Lachnospiraceae bacterium]|nr:arsenic transporter [Lachnospiraceae bacterium]